MENQDNKRKLYDALSEDYDMGSYEQFCTDIQDESKRKKLYDATSEEYDFGDYDSFSEQLGFGKTAQSQTRSTTSIGEQSLKPAVKKPSINSLSPDDMERLSKIGKHGMNEFLSLPERGQQQWTPVGERKLPSDAADEYEKVKGNGPAMVDMAERLMDRNRRSMQSYSDQVAGINQSVGKSDTTYSGKKFNPATKKIEDVYLTPGGKKFGNKAEADMESFNYRQNQQRMREEEQRKREEQLKLEHSPSLGETVGKSIGSGFLRAGAGLLDALQALSSGMIVEDPSSPTGYTRMRAYDESLLDRSDPLTYATSVIHKKADSWSEESQPYSGRKGFLDLLWDGEIGNFLQKGVATAGESLPMTLSAFNPYTMTLNAISMSGSNYRENTLSNPDIPAWKRASQAIGSAAIEQAVEKYSDPVFKYFGGLKLLKGSAKDLSGSIVSDVTHEATESLSRRIYGMLKGLGKDAVGEGVEEIVSAAGNDVLGETLDLVDGKQDYGLRAQWEDFKQKNKEADLMDFSWTKAKEYVESFIGGALAGAYTSGTAQVSGKALQYVFDRTGVGAVEADAGVPLSPLDVDIAQSFDDGYTEDESQSMNEAKNLYELRKERLSVMVGVSSEELDDVIGNPLGFIEEMERSGRTGYTDVVLDYINAKAKYDGMMQRVRDDIDGQIEQSNALVDSRINKSTGMIQGATMKQNDRKVYIISGNVVPYEDGTGIDVSRSGSSIIVRDAETGAFEQISPEAILSIEEEQDPQEQKQIASETIRQQFATDAANKIDGVVGFNPGDTYTIVGDEGQQVQIRVVANEQGIVDNGDGTVNVTNGTQIFPFQKDVIQQNIDAQNAARVYDSENQRMHENIAANQTARAESRPHYTFNDQVTLRDAAGNVIHGQIADHNEADDTFVVDVDNPINGQYAPNLTREQLDDMVVEYNGHTVKKPSLVFQQNVVEAPVQEQVQEPASEVEQEELQHPSTIERIPKDEQGQPVYEQADSDTAYDAIVEESGGDVELADEVINDILAEKKSVVKAAEKALKKLLEAKPSLQNGPLSVRERIAAKTAAKEAQAQAQAEVDQARMEQSAWERIANTPQRRRMAAEEARLRQQQEVAAAQQEEEERKRAAQAEAERLERESLMGVPDVVDDTAVDARARGFRRVNGNKVERQAPLDAQRGKDVTIKFAEGVLQPGTVAIIDASQLQPSHISGHRNPVHFLDEAQPKERKDTASIMAVDRIAGNIRPEEITSSVTAFTGAPTVNSRGEVIQGNNRSAALRTMWDSYPDQASAYRKYLMDHAEEFGLNAEDIFYMEHPVLVNMLDVADGDAIVLGQYVAQDTESGGVERIQPKNVLQKMGNDISKFTQRLLASTDDDVSLSALIDRNGGDVLRWMSARKFISNTQYQSAFDSRGNLTAEAKNDLQGILYQSIFAGGGTQLEEMFSQLPARAQKAILSTAYRDSHSMQSDRMLPELQQSIRAYYALMQDSQFAEAKNFKDARIAVEDWKRQYQMDDVTGESYLPADNFSNFALHLASMYKVETQGLIQNTLNHIYDLVQGTQEVTFFETPDNTPRTLSQAIFETLKIPNDGQLRSDVLAGNRAAGQKRRQGSDGIAQARERVEDGEQSSDSTGGTESGSRQSEVVPEEESENVLSERVQVDDDDWTEGSGKTPTYKRSVLIDGKYRVTQVDEPNSKGDYDGSYFEYDGKRFSGIPEVIEYIDNNPTLGEKIESQEQQVNTNPSDAQKEAGNYKKGHIQVGSFNVTIEQPKGSVRRGTDEKGNSWETTMQNTYGYIRGTEGVDGDHIDVFLSNDIDGWNGRRVFVVDQYNENGSFDEHKVMMGFNSQEEAQDAYFSNYDKDWADKRKIVVTSVNLEDFEKWIQSSHRKTKPFAEYKSLNTEETVVVSNSETTTPANDYTIGPTQYTTRRGNVLDMYLVKFGRELTKEEQRNAKTFAKELKGWYDSKQGGFMMRSNEDARSIVDFIVPKETIPAVTSAPADVSIFPGNEDLFQLAERIAKEEEEKRNSQEKSGKEPVSLERWRQMGGDERMSEAEKRPLTREEIENSTTDEVLKANALDYLNGNHGMIQSISYLNVYEDVRYSNGNLAADSGTADGTQLDEAHTGSQQGLDGTSGGSRRVPSELLDREQGEGTLPGLEGYLQHNPDSEERDASGAGERGNSDVPGEEQSMGGRPVRGRERGGSRSSGSHGRNGERGRTERSDQSAGNDRERGTEAPRGRNSRNGGSQSISDDIDAFLSDALKEFDDVLDEFKRAGNEELSVSLIGLSSRQLEVLPRLISAGAKVGYTYIRRGVHNFVEWANQMRAVFGKKLSDAGLGENEIDAFINEMWKSRLPMDGELYTLEEWASILGKAELRIKVGESLDEKRKAQQAAESIAVKICDRDNIAETLPFLLPQQQDDVLKAETQFFDERHNDRDHAFGKGYMFTNGTGTGKTYTGLGIVKRFIKQGKGRVLILTPSQTKVKDWIKDAANLDIELNDLDAVAKAKKDGTTATTEKGEGAVITTYANFRQNKALLEDLFDLIVYDESHRLLENKGGIGTTGAIQHYKLSNRNENYAYLRLQEINPMWNEYQAKVEEFEGNRDAVIERLKKENGITNEIIFGKRGGFPPALNGAWAEDEEQQFHELAKIRKEILALSAKYENEVKPELERQAKEDAKHTKVVFLSATPFNTRENLDYAEEYIFSYPESERPDGYSSQSPRSQFYLEHFGSGYKWRYHRLESTTTNPEALSKQEVEFSDYLQHTLQTMSGRIIDSPFDYSRDFPTVTLDKAEEFNGAMEELSHDDATWTGYHKVVGDYNYTSALFESMKVAQIIPRLKEHLTRGRKIVVFHRRMESKKPLIPPFKAIFDESVKALEGESDATKKAEKKRRIAALRRKYAGMLEWEQTLDLRMPREQLADAFGKNNVLFFSGQESEKTKKKAVGDFNSDTSGKNIIVIQEASGKEGISLHDTTGDHQRVLVTLALPQSPITALQIEGRIYRIGNRSNAIFEYPLLGLNTELILFGQKFNQQVSTTENLALGSQARNLRESFSRGVEEHSGDVDIDSQGVGGKEFDAPNRIEKDAFDSAVLDYYTNQKLTGKRDNREGTDYYPTPEPLGFMMNQWGRIGEGESVLEPSAGHGAIARYVPRENPLTAVEPSQSLFSKLQIKVGGNGRKFENTVFENYNVVNKHDVVLMNPPFGTGGKLAVDHVAKAFQHLEEGGRIVSIIPRGSTDKKFDKWYEGQKDAVMTAEIALPDITFERAGTSVNCRVVVIDKVTNENLREDAASRLTHVNLSERHYEKIEDFFEDIRNIIVPERTIDQKAKLKKKAVPVARELRTVKGIRDVILNEDRIYVSGNGVWAEIRWADQKGDELTAYLAERYGIFKGNHDYAAKNGKETQEAAYGELKALACKLAGMTEDEMQRYISKRNAEDLLYRSDDTVEETNARFNEKLDKFTIERADHFIFNLGMPSSTLLAGGVENKPIKLYGSKIAKKMRKHGFESIELRDLPLALARPVAVFNNTERPGNRSVLTELKTENGNILVTLDLGKGMDADFDIVSSVFGKSGNSVVHWLNKGFATYIDKEKALNYLHLSAPIAEASNGQELSSATKIVESFENPSVNGENLLEIYSDKRDNLTTNSFYKSKEGVSQRAISLTRPLHSTSRTDGATLNDIANISQMFDTSILEDENLREGDGAFTDDELSYENDPVAKMPGNPRRTRSQRKAFSERERKRMVKRVQELAEKLHLDNVDIITDASILEGNRSKAKGFFNKRTGKITIVIPNHVNTFDVEQTLLHEAVSHYGLRQLFGEHFDTFLDNVYQNADEKIRRKIFELATNHGWNFRTATEEYLASLAERTNFENMDHSWWMNIKELFLRMLHQIGFEGFSGVTLTDNELRYILWRSYENLVEPGRYRSILGEAADVAKQYELKVGNYAESAPKQSAVAEDDLLFRSISSDMSSDEIRDIQEEARRIYEESVKDTGERSFVSALLYSLSSRDARSRFKHKFSESYFDYSRSVKMLQSAIERASGKVISGFENVWAAINTKSSVDSIEIERFQYSYVQPLYAHIGHMIKGKRFRGAPMSADDVEIYLNALHGQERNLRMAEIDAERDAIAACGGMMPEPKDKSADDYAIRHEKWEEWRRFVEREKSLLLESRRDYSGLTALFGDEVEDRSDVVALERAAESFCREFESAIGDRSLVDGLLDKVSALNRFTLRKTYISGLISNEEYDLYMNMYRHYVPLRGWHDNYSGDVYQYLSSGVNTERLQSVIKRAYGRKSRAAHILGTMAAMGNLAIVQGNKNIVVNRMMNLAENHRDAGLLKVSRQWYSDNGDGVLYPIYPELSDGMSAEEMQLEVDRFEKNMEDRSHDDVKLVKTRFSKEFPYRMAKWQEEQHSVRVMRNGREYRVYVLGNPKAAQAVSGLLNPDVKIGAVGRFMMSWLRFRAKMQTSFSPEFMFGNFQRDVLTASAGMYIIYGKKAHHRYASHLYSLLPGAPKISDRSGSDLNIFQLLRRYQKGRLDKENPKELWFAEFCDHGGMTGISSILNNEEFERQMMDTVRHIRHSKLDIPREMASSFFSAVEFINRCVENATRFAVYMSLRESGRSVSDCIFVSKNATINFNMKGSGAWGNLWMRRYIIYSNVALQALRMLGTWHSANPRRFYEVMSLPVLASYLTAFIFGLLGESDDDNDDEKSNGNEWYALSEWNRYNFINVKNPFGNGYFHWSIPQEFRPAWAMGQIFYDLQSGRITEDRALHSMLTQINNLTPMSFIAGGTDSRDGFADGFIKAWTPTIASDFIDVYHWNSDFLGRPITNQQDWNALEPEWQRSVEETPAFAISLSRKWNALTGGSGHRRGWGESEYLNPSAVYYLLEQQFGGVGTLFTKTNKMVEQLFDDEDGVELKNIPFVSKFYVGTKDDYSKHRVLNDRFYLQWNEFNVIDHEISSLRSDLRNGRITRDEYDSSLSALESSGDMSVWRNLKKYEKVYHSLRKASREGNEQAKERLLELKRQVVSASEDVVE